MKIQQILLTMIMGLVVVCSMMPGCMPAQTSADDEFNDTTLYAQNSGVSVEEAERRLELQRIAGELQEKLNSNEGETFAGIWIEHTPELKIIVSFTSNAEETIQPYLTEATRNIVEVKTAKYSLKALSDEQTAILSILNDLALPVDSSINVQNNKVEIMVADKSKLDSLISEGKLSISDKISIIYVDEPAKPDTEIFGD